MHSLLGMSRPVPVCAGLQGKRESSSYPAEGGLYWQAGGSLAEPAQDASTQGQKRG